MYTAIVASQALFPPLFPHLLIVHVGPEPSLAPPLQIHGAGGAGGGNKGEITAPKSPPAS